MNIYLPYIRIYFTLQMSIYYVKLLHNEAVQTSVRSFVNVFIKQLVNLIH